MSLIPAVGLAALGGSGVGGGLGYGMGFVAGAGKELYNTWDSRPWKR